MIRQIAAIALTIPISLTGCARQNELEKEFAQMHEAYLAEYRPVAVEAERAWWNAATTGSDEAFAKKESYDKQIVELHGNKDRYARLKALKDSGRVDDPMLARELDVMYRAHVPGQADPELQKKIIAIQTEVEKVFTNHRADVDGKQLSENDVRDVLGSTKNSAAAKAAWTGFVEVGRKIETQLRECARLRNELARKLGYRDYFAMQLALQEVDEQELFAIFDEMDALTRGPFERLKAEIDANRAGHFGITVAGLRPWHYGDIFFQEAPPMPGPDLNAIYADKDLLVLTKKYYHSLGLDPDDILARSDLYERPGKNSHAFATHIDREGDTRVLCNLQPNMRWMDTLIHELGHAVYDKYIDRKLPFVLRVPSHPITTEGYAMMMGAMAKKEEYLRKVVGLPPGEADAYVVAARESLRAEKLIFSRWAQVMTRFERAMYADPEQDLAKLWWDIKKQYQAINPPDDASLPGYAAKVHVVSNPVYYHSYALGDLFASQVHNHIATKIVRSDVQTTSYFDSTAAGEYMKREIFEPGNLYPWNELTRRATGERLTAKYFAQQYVGEDRQRPMTTAMN
ncbi:MAG TPA: M2 family metallopeptidase [Phycisphaerae bacterium]|nr:M2 family metallopeptidase [Phycisphaerae bacterium]